MNRHDALASVTRNGGHFPAIRRRVVVVAAGHLDGIPWWSAPMPPRRHLCRPQSLLIDSLGRAVDRCRCGGIRPTGRLLGWTEKNTRRNP